MIKKLSFTLLFLYWCSIAVFSQNKADSLLSRDHFIEEVVVTGTRNKTDLRHLPMSISIINRDAIENRYEQSLLPILNELVPSFFSTSRGVLGYGVSTGSAGAMSLRGVGGTPTAGLLVLIDGHPQFMGLMGHPIADAYQSVLAEKVEVLRGSASVLYGSNAMGGVVNIVTQKQEEDGIRNNFRLSYGSYNTLMTEGVSRVRKGKFNGIASASYNRTDGHRLDQYFEQYSGYLKLGYDINDRWKTFADANLTQFKASNPGQINIPVFDNDSRITRGVASFSIENDYKNTSGALKFFYNWGQHRINDGYKKEEPPKDYRFRSEDLMLGINWFQSLSLFQGNVVTVGLDFQHFGGEAWNQFTDRRKSLADETENNIAGYISVRQALSEKLTLDGGVRLDHHSRTGTIWIPQGGLALQLPLNAEFRGMVSRGFRNPTIREMYMFPPQNPDLQPERLMTYEVSYSQRLLKSKLSYNLNLFYINGSNMIQTLPIDGQPKNVNTGKIENWGTEASVRYRINQMWNISANYSWLNMEFPVIAAPEHKLYAEVNLSKKRWNISTGVQYIHGLYTTLEPETKENFVLWSVRGTFHLHSLVDLFVRGENLLAQRYEINQGYPMPKATIMGGFNLNF